MTFYQNGWDKKDEKVVDAEVIDRYITNEGDEVTVLAPSPVPEAGHWCEHGDVVYEIIGDALDDIANSSD